MKIMRMNKKVSKDFEIKNIGKYHDLYIQIIHYCQPKYLRTLEICVLNYTNFILQRRFFNSLKKTKVKLDLLTNIDMLLIVEEGIRGVIYHSVYQCAKANGKCMKDYA